MSGAAGAGVAINIAEAIKASGVLVEVEPETFQNIVSRCETPLVVQAEGGVFSTKFKYLVSYKGLAFHTKTKRALTMPMGTEIVNAKSISIPAT